MNNFEPVSANILCVAMDWFPQTPGGLNRYVYELTHQLSLGADCVELCGVGLPQTSLNSKVKLTNLAEPDRPLWQRLYETRRSFLKRQAPKPDAVNLHFALYSLPLLQHLPKDVPVTFTFHGPWAFESEQEGASRLSVWMKQQVEQRVYQRCDRFIVLSKAFGTILHQDYGVPWEKIEIIPGGVDTTLFQPTLSRQEARAQLNWSLDRPILFTPRRLVHRMGLDKLLAALVQVKQQVPDVWLAIAGRGALRQTLEHQAYELGLEDHVKFLGFLPDEQLPIAYQAADLTIVPSQSLEGFGLVLLESLACGTPALCTPIGGMPEVLMPLCPNLITQSVTELAIAEHIQAVLTGELALPSRNECREYALNRFDWKVIAPQVRQVLLRSI